MRAAAAAGRLPGRGRGRHGGRLPPASCPGAPGWPDWRGGGGRRGRGRRGGVRRARRCARRGRDALPGRAPVGGKNEAVEERACKQRRAHETCALVDCGWGCGDGASARGRGGRALSQLPPTRPLLSLSLKAARAAQAELDASWAARTFRVAEVYVLVREGDGGQFKIAATLPLGATSGTPPTPTPPPPPPPGFPGIPPGVARPAHDGGRRGRWCVDYTQRRPVDCPPLQGPRGVGPKGRRQGQVLPHLRRPPLGCVQPHSRGAWALFGTVGGQLNTIGCIPGGIRTAAAPFRRSLVA